MKKLTGLIISFLQGRMKWNKLQKNLCIKTGVMILSAAVLNLSVGCRSYFKVNSSSKPSVEKISELNQAGKNMVVHYGSEKWLLAGVEVKNDTIYGFLQDYNRPPTLKPIKYDRANRYKPKTGRSNSQRFLLNEVHLFLDNHPGEGKDQVSIPVNDINKVDIYNKDSGTTIASWVAGGLLLAIGIVTLVALSSSSSTPTPPPVVYNPDGTPAESCPFIYTWDGENYSFAGEIYSGSIHKPLERDDYLKLPVYPNQKTYTIKMTNESYEMQHTNMMELLVVDHPDNSEVLIDKYGKIACTNKSLKPISANTLSGKNVLSSVIEKDDLFYHSISTASIRDGIIMEFPVKQRSGNIQLAIHAKNSILLDYAFSQYHDLYGSAYNRYVKYQQKAPADEGLQWAFDQGIPLKLFVERGGKWEFEDYYNVAGPVKLKDDVLSFPLKGNEPDPIRIKLEYGNFLWEIDYAALGYPDQESVTLQKVPVKTALVEGENDVSRILASNDKHYFIQAPQEKTALLTFDLPEMKDQKRSIILHSKGWYQVLRNPSGKPKIKYLKTFMAPGQFNRFVNEQVKKMELQYSDAQ